ncbi:MAG: hypothetical protein JO147_04145 [Actinobacteria bacterium]|nr:hypothetical protein [Actinomycetota bacterium]
MPKRGIPAAFVPAELEGVLDSALDRALALQRRPVAAYVARQRKRAHPADVIARLERRYLTAVTGIGAASGGVAALPGVGTAASLASGLAEVAAFVEATAVFVLGVAEVHGIQVTDKDVRRALVLGIVLGDTGAVAIEAAGAADARWAQVVARGVNHDSVGRLNKMLLHHFLTRFGTRQGALLLGRALPFGVGAGIGAVGNAALGRAAVRAARRAFGPPPVSFGPRVIDG